MFLIEIDYRSKGSPHEGHKAWQYEVGRLGQDERWGNFLSWYLSIWFCINECLMKLQQRIFDIILALCMRLIPSSFPYSFIT